MPIFNVECLYRVNLAVQADSQSDAFKVAKNEFNNSLAFYQPDPEVWVLDEIKSLDQLPREWDGDCIPFGGDNNAYLRDLLPAKESLKGGL